MPSDRVVETMARQADLFVLTGILGLILVNVASVFAAYLLGVWLPRRRFQASPFARLALGSLTVSFCTALPGSGVSL